MNALSFLLMLTGVASSILNGGYEDKNLGVAFPDQLGGLVFQERETFPHPGLGYKLRYQDTTLFKVDIYVYDNGIKNIGKSIESQKVKNEFNNTLAIFTYMSSLGEYTDLSVLDQGTREIGKMKYLWAQHEYKQSEGPETAYHGMRLSDSYLTAVNNFFVKVRLTIKKEDMNRSLRKKETFMQALSTILASDK